jgi:hypothetical protein
VVRSPPLDRLERVPPRVRKFLLSHSSGLAEGSAATEGMSPRRGPPDHQDERNIAARLRLAASSRQGLVLPGHDPALTATALARTLVDKARNAVSRLENGASDSALNADDFMALEAVLHTRGRPALKVEGDRLESLDEVAHPGSGFWRAFLDDHESDLIAVASAAGAVRVKQDFGGTWVQGTAWLIRGDLVVTNRHVLFPPQGEALAQRRVEDPPTATMKAGLTVTIDFVFDYGPPDRASPYTAVDVPFVSADTDPIDVAVIRLAPPAAATAPKPLAVSGQSLESDQLYIVGHPGRMQEVPDDVNAVFGSPDEHKRVSLGEIMDADAATPDELIHDASTIGGYSGGCVLGFGSRAVRGLHYLGDAAAGNRAFKASALLVHPVGVFLR